MLVKFQSSTDGSILMFADAAAPLLLALGKEPTARGVMAAAELPALANALTALRDGAAPDALFARDRQAGSDPVPEAAAHSGGDAELPISLRQRVTPLLELIERTRTNEGYLLWEAPEDFGAGG